jgi:rare lipoprotein A
LSAIRDAAAPIDGANRIAAALSSSSVATALSAASTLTRSAIRLHFLLAVYLLSASVALLPAGPRVDSFFDPTGTSRVVAGVSQARVAAVHTVMGAHVARLRPSPEPSQPKAPADGAISGIATWYGGADGYGSEDTMADGSPFNPDDPTIAASNAWPLGVWLVVCHGERCIPVCVRDRGSFRHAVDLSRAAFAQLAPLSSGVIDVTVQALP